MTFEEMRKMMDKLTRQCGDLAEHSIRQREILDRRISYRSTNESDYLNLEERLEAIETRRKRLENRN